MRDKGSDSFVEILFMPGLIILCSDTAGRIGLYSAVCRFDVDMCRKGQPCVSDGPGWFWVRILAQLKEHCFSTPERRFVTL